LPFQPGKVVFDRAPDNIDVHIKIIVDHFVAHAPHFDPWQIGMRRHEFRGVLLNFPGGFANDLDIAYDGVLIALALAKGAHAIEGSM